MSDDKMSDLQETVADVLAMHFDSYNYDVLYKYVAPDVLNELKYYDLIALVMEKDKQIEDLQIALNGWRNKEF